MTFIVNKNII